MIKIGQQASLVLTVNDVATATSAHSAYQKPTGTRGEWAGALDASALTVTSSIAEGDLDMSGKWRVIAVVTYPDGSVIRGTAYEFTVYDVFD